MKIKIALLSVSTMFLFACGTETPDNSERNQAASTYNPESYDQTMRFITENFELEYGPKDNNLPNYLLSYDIRNISDNIIMGLNASGQVSYLSFDRITRNELDIVLENLKINEEEDVELLLNNGEEFRDKYNQSYLILKGNDPKIDIHILNFKISELEGYREDVPYDINLFYNEKLFEDFMNN